MKTMQKNKGLKKRGKGLALGICAAILGTVGVAWIPQHSGMGVCRELYGCRWKDGNQGFSKWGHRYCDR